MEVVAIYPAAQPVLLKAIWRALRARLIADGHWERALHAAAVLHALDSVSAADLSAVHIKGAHGELLLWVDLGAGRPIASFPEPHVYLAGLED